jgi:hypothetical protein
LRGDAPALALRGIALARLGDLVRAKVLMRVQRAPSVEIDLILVTELTRWLPS